MSFSIKEVELLESQVLSIEKDLNKAIFYKTQLELARSVAARKIAEAAENISLLKQPGIVVSLNEFAKIQRALFGSTLDLKKIDDDLFILNKSVNSTNLKLDELKKTIKSVREKQERNVVRIKDKELRDDEEN